MDKGGVNSRLNSYGVLDRVQTDGPGFCVLHPLNRLVLDFKMGGLTE